MKTKAIIILVFGAILAMSTLFATSAQAHGYNGHYYRGGHYRPYNWVAPVVIGGAIGYGLTRNYYEPYYAPPPPVVYTQPPVVVSPPPVYQSTCTRYVYQDQYGNTTREETRCN